MNKLTIRVLCAACALIGLLKAETEAEVMVENFLQTYLGPSSNAALVRVDDWELGGLEAIYRTVYYNAKVLKVLKGGFTVNADIRFFKVFEGTPTTAELNERLGKKYYIFPRTISSEFFVDVGEGWKHSAALETAVTNAGY